MATDNQFEKLKKWVEDFRKKEDVEISCMAHDVASEDDWQSVLNKVLLLYKKVDVLIIMRRFFHRFWDLMILQKQIGIR